jgi:putative membrane protein insertion efficiency factor
MLKKIIFATIRFYQLFISPNLSKHCRFYPSCSNYAYLAIKKYGTIPGIWRSLKRVLKCYPWHPGGVDLP